MGKEENVAADQPTEEPTLEPSQEGGTQEVSAEEQAKALLEELKGFGVENPDDLRGMAIASQQAGNLANQLGEARAEIAALNKKIEALSTQPAQTQPQTMMDEFGNPTIDMNQIAKKDDIKEVLRSFYQEEIIRPQQQATQEAMRQLAEIQRDEDFPMLQPVWEKHINNPNVQIALQTGQTSIQNEYNKVWKTFYRESLKRSKGVLEAFTSKGVKPPHVESGNSQTGVPQSNQQGDTVTKKLNDMEKPESGWTGEDDQNDGLVRELQPADDPIFR